MRVGDNQPALSGYWNGYDSGNALCVLASNLTAGGPNALDCTQPVRGRYLTVQMDPAPSPGAAPPLLNICELQVFASKWAKAPSLWTNYTISFDKQSTPGIICLVCKHLSK